MPGPAAQGVFSQQPGWHDVLEGYLGLIGEDTIQDLGSCPRDCQLFRRVSTQVTNKALGVYGAVINQRQRL